MEYRKNVYIFYEWNKRPHGLTAPLSNNTWSIIHSPMNTQWPWFDLSMPPKVKCCGVNWKTIYDLLYRDTAMRGHPVIRGHFLKTVSYLSHVKELWRRDTCHVGTFSLGYRCVPWRQVLLYVIHLGDTTLWMSCDLERLSKYLEVNWQFIDDFLYMLLINYGQNVLSLWNIACWKPNDLDLPFQYHQRWYFIR